MVVPRIQRASDDPSVAHPECTELSSWTAKGATSYHVGEGKTLQVGASKFSIDEIVAGEAVIVATVYRSDHSQILTLVMKVAQVRGISRSETLFTIKQGWALMTFPFLLSVPLIEFSFPNSARL